MDKEVFFKEYNINPEEFEALNIEWSELEMIYQDYIFNLLPTLNAIEKYISEIIRSIQVVHSVRSRVKDPNHLIEKIIRKTIEKREKTGNSDYKIDLDNYNKEITDLIGIRALHLYKNDAEVIGKLITNTWELFENPTIYIREGDSSSLELIEENTLNYEEKTHDSGYRSWHYLIKINATKLETIAEIQIRTIFEEGWSEIDHQLRYPYNLDNASLNNQLMILNRITGLADEMTTNILNTKMFIDQHNETKDKAIQELREEIDQLQANKEISQKTIEDLSKKLQKVEANEKHTVSFIPDSLDINSSILQNYYIDTTKPITISAKYLNDSPMTLSAKYLNDNPIVGTTELLSQSVRDFNPTSVVTSPTNNEKK